MPTDNGPRRRAGPRSGFRAPDLCGQGGVGGGQLGVQMVHAPGADQGVTAYSLLRGIGNPCVGADSRYDARRLVDLLVMGLRIEAAGRHLK
ncbi:hypothetical protein ACIQXD_01855 [Streptomyces uncialis]|uniref:hypothetical protein n=1 Tax=Streptomyces uncialis TaxID=1048205 RepID=UPI0037F1F7F3